MPQGVINKAQVDDSSIGMLVTMKESSGLKAGETYSGVLTVVSTSGTTVNSSDMPKTFDIGFDSAVALTSAAVSLAAAATVVIF